MKIVCLAAFLLPVTICSAVDLTHAQRFNTVAIPKLQQAPIIDGTVDKREWAGAALAPRLVDSESGLATEGFNKVYLGYDDKNLYIAFKVYRSFRVGSPQAAVTEHDKEILKDDHFELFLDPGRKRISQWFLAGNAVSAALDRKENEGQSGDLAWNPAWQYQARITHDGWEGELAIPFASLGTNTPQVGEVWGMDFINHQETPIFSRSVLAYRNEEEGGKGFGEIVFAGGIPTVRFLEAGKFENAPSVGGIQLEIINFTASETPVDVKAKLLKRIEGSTLSYLPGIRSGTKAEGGDRIKDQSIEELSADLLKQNYTPAPEEAIQQQFNLQPGERQTVFLKTKQIGEYLVQYDITSGGTTLDKGDLSFKLAPPMVLTLTPYTITSQSVEVEADLQAIDEWAEGWKVTFTLASANGEKIYQTQEKDFDPSNKLTADLSTKDLPPGNYSVTVALADGAGAPRGSNQEMFEIHTPPEWYRNTLGLTPAIPEPWTPIEVKTQGNTYTLKVWGRTYVFDKGPIPSVIESRGESMLAAPPSLSSIVNGKPIQWELKKSGIVSQKPEEVVLEFENEAGGVKLTSRVSCAFDGLLRCNLTLSAPAGISLDELFVNIPFKKSFATLYQTEVFLRPDDYKGTAKALTGTIPDTGIAHPIALDSWVGHEERGVFGAFQNDRGWSYNEKNKAIEVIPEKNDVLWRFRLVDKPTALVKERQIEFGLMATPSRPWTKDWDKIHTLLISGLSKSDDVQHAKMQELIRDAKAVNVNVLMAHSTWNSYETGEGLFGYPGFGSEKTKANVTEDVSLAHSLGMKVLFYSGWNVHTEAPEWKNWGHELIRSPAGSCGYKTLALCWNSRYPDFKLYKLVQLIKEVGIDGSFWDSTGRPIPCNNLHHKTEIDPGGCGWYDDDGKLQSSFPIWGSREFFMRYYRVLKHDLRKDGIIFFGNPGIPFMVIENFADIHNPGEGPESHAKHVKDAFKIDYVRARQMGDQFGIMVERQAKGAIPDNEYRSIMGLHNVTSKGTAYELLQGMSKFDGTPLPPLLEKDLAYGITHRPIINTWAARDWMGLSDAEWLPYWRNSQYVNITPSNDAYVSFHLKKGKKALVQISNLEDKARVITAAFDLKAMGFTAGQVWAVDAFTDELYPFEKGELRIPIESSRYRYIKLTTEKPAAPANALKTTGDNLILHPGFENLQGGDKQGSAAFAPNPGMEKKHPKGDAFEIWTPLASYEPATFSVDSSVSHSGKASLKVVRNKVEGSWVPATLFVKVDVKPHTKYVLFAKVKIDGRINCGNTTDQLNGIGVDVLGGDGKRVGYGRRVEEDLGEWRDSRCIFDSGENSEISVQVQMNGTGTAWLDDVALFEVDQKI